MAAGQAQVRQLREEALREMGHPEAKRERARLAHGRDLKVVLLPEAFSGLGREKAEAVDGCVV